MATSHYELYVSSYAAANQSGIYAFVFDDQACNLQASWSFTGIPNPSFLLLHPNKRWLYVVSETHLLRDGKAGEVWSLALSNQTNIPQVINHQASGGDWPCHLAMDATGNWLFVSNYATGTLGVFPILENGALGEMTHSVQHQGHGSHAERQKEPHIHSTVFTPDGRFLLVADLGIDQIVMYTFDPFNGQLHEHARIHARPGSGPRHMAFHPDGQHLYVSHELNNTVGVYTYDAAREVLDACQIIETLPPDAQESLVADIHLAPAGNRVFVTNRGHDSVTVFAVEAGGQLKRLANVWCGGHWPRHFALAPGGQFLLLANQYSGDVTILPVLEQSEALGEPCARTAISGASCVQFAGENPAGTRDMTKR